MSAQDDIDALDFRRVIKVGLISHMRQGDYQVAMHFLLQMFTHVV